MFTNLETLTPEILFFTFHFFNNKLSASITRIKSKGDKGQPLPLLKKSVTYPLMITTKEGEVTQLIILLVN
jgi:hypothetical protein